MYRRSNCGSWLQAELPLIVSVVFYQAQQTQPSYFFVRTLSRTNSISPGPAQDIPDAQEVIDEPEEAGGKNPRLPLYDDTHDPELWFNQVDVAFQTYRTLHSQQAA